MKIEIKNHLVYVDGVQAPFFRATLTGGPIDPTVLVYHDTADHPEPDKRDTINWFTSAEATGSAHLLVQRDGQIVQFIPLNLKAAHAGKSTYKGREKGGSINGCSIGIEMDNPGACDANGRAWFHRQGKKLLKGFDIDRLQRMVTKQHQGEFWMPYPEEQVETMKALSHAIIKAYPKIDCITTHWEISPGRKSDPNPLFPLDEVVTAAYAHEGDKAPVAAWVKPEPVPGANFNSTAEMKQAGVAPVATLSILNQLQAWLLLVFGGGTIANALGLFKSTLNEIIAILGNHQMMILLCGLTIGLGLSLGAQWALQKAARRGEFKPTPAIENEA